ncbi:MAG TPA: protein-methionine-sulfoxide reductase heme-binding subunit MsrQ [Polyangiaceae bacterium]|nr:protein-methionine-sulfoxide reductase heme-binding subunit MsrQ [Polyangiaceae bacterium]
MAATSRRAYLAPAFVTGWLLALAQLGYRLAKHELGANPIATALNQLGLLALVLLVATLCATPLKLTLGWTWPLRVRRTLGLLAFFTVLLHFVVYLGPDQGFNLGAVLSDIGKRPFIAVGFLAFVLLLPLAWTSSKKAVQRLTFPVWQRLHRLVYPIAALAALHFYLRVKADHTQPLIYAFIIAAGFAIRTAAWRSKARSKRARASAV